MFFILDNYDSFVYNLSAYFEELGQEIKMSRPEDTSLDEIEQLNPEGIVISPGPGHPFEADFSIQIIEKFKEKVPILGVCLGHQSIAYYFGAEVKKGKQPVHGKITYLSHNSSLLFNDLPSRFKVTRYHSLVVYSDTIPKGLQVDAYSDDGTVMSISHKKFPVYGVQFHPEAVLTEYGHNLIHNYIKICKEWGRKECRK
jgi:anthranilate synthase/aminodeoxychorismate synthase-like glutamine amidotransferase